MMKSSFCLALFLLLAHLPATGQSAAGVDSSGSDLAYAVAWKQTAAEYRALFHQGFNVARHQVASALANRTGTDKPLAVIADLDDTLLLSNPYWGYLVANGEHFFSDSDWDAWISSNRTVASPGAIQFLRYCQENQVEVFYITNRDQGENTFQLALNNLVSAGFPYADLQHLTVLRDSSNKEVIQDRIREEYEVVALLGDNLNDFSRRYYVTDVNERATLMEQDRARFGTEYVLFPNPTDGHWMRAIFGESEPEPSLENRQRLQDAAARDAWQPVFAATDPMDYQFTYSTIASSGSVAELENGIRNSVMTAMRLSGAQPYALWTPVIKPDDAPFAGLDPQQVILMLAWPRPAAELVESLETVLQTLPGVTSVSTKLYAPIYLSDGLQVSTDAGFYVHRDEHYPIAGMDEAVRLSREAWVTWEPHWGVKVAGLFRELGVEGDVARLNRIAWYPSYEVWLATRNNDDVESQRRFRERRQYLIEGSGVAVATDRVPLP